MASKQTEWSRAYNEKAYERLYITVPKGDKDKIKLHASAFGDGGSVNAFINRAIAETMERDEQRRAKLRQEIIDSCPDADELTMSMLVCEREGLQRAMRERLSRLKKIKEQRELKKKREE